MFKTTMGFKTIKHEVTKAVIRAFRPQVEITFPQLELVKFLDHDRIEAVIQECMTDVAKKICQEKERAAAEVSGNTAYMHDVQADANAVTVDMVIDYVLAGRMNKEDIVGWWAQVAAPATRAYFKNAKNYDETKIAAGCAWYISKFTLLHAGKLLPDESVHRSLTVCLERLEAHAVRDYLLEKLQPKKTVEEFDHASLD